MRWTATDLDGPDFEKSHAAGSDRETITPTIHLTLQGKGGVGKSLVASILAQYLVDRHYRRLAGFSILTTLFTAFEASQRSTQSALTYPTPTQTAGAAVGQELSQTGDQITRRNPNVQPTIKVPAGYKFTVRVNRDILFELPYEPAIRTSSPTMRGTRGPTSKIAVLRAD